MERWTRFSLQRPRLVLVLLLIVSGGLAAGLPHLRPEYGYRVLIGADHPAIARLEAFIDTFGGGQPVSIAWECGDAHVCEHPLDRRSVRMAHDVGSQLAALAAVRRVSSAANTSVIVPDANGFSGRHLVESGEFAADFDVLVERAAHDALWRGTLISEDGKAGKIVLQTAATSPETESLVTDAVLAALAPYEAAGWAFAIRGAAAGSVVSGRALDHSVAALIPVLVAMIGVMLFVLSGSWREAAVSLATIGVAVLWTFGLLGWLGWPQDGILEVLAPLVLTVGVCNSVHVLTRANEIESQGGTRSASLVAAAREVGPACLATTATTCAAFLSFTTSDLDTFVRFGSVAAFGVLACLVASFTLLPILAAQIPGATREGEPTHPGRVERALRLITSLSQRRPVATLLLLTLLTGASGAGLAQLRVDNNWTKSFGDQSTVGRWENEFRRMFGFSSSLDLTFTLPSAAMLVDPSSLETLDAISQRIVSSSAFRRPVGLNDAISRLNRALHADDPAFARTGRDARANAELIEMLAFDDPEMLGNWLSIDRTTVRLSFESPLDSQLERSAALAVAERDVQSLLPEGWTYSFEGEVPTLAQFVTEVLGMQLRSFPTATLLVWVLVCMFLGSIPLGTAALVPTLVPVVWTLGVMGWASMDLDIGRSMVAAIVIGIGIDDSIHLLHRYQIARNRGHNIDASMSTAVEASGRALLTTSVALASGFLVLRLAAWETISSFGVLVAFTISAALVCTLVALPAGFALAGRLERPSARSAEPASRLSA